MIEDSELTALVRDALEEDGAFTYRSRRKGVVWGASALLAASVTLVFALSVVFAPSAAADPVEEAIGLLSFADGDETLSAATGVELLAAWQEAPLEPWSDECATWLRE